ncbi:hypothetical protein QWZ03_09930 [Chitinimonas viridis]|uniref:HTH HARE-type domain-containing protein n=1 Tax=Chitinimonas viridis TaxID=664880 RepID=A0ABT8B4N6_9NEIS|nr:hypothetical protein [Chitinimonas viridis]MDN3577083.1 hypothetical protein [Chitinimonas viridis]
MSNIHIPPSLKWLITKRARLLGSLNKQAEVAQTLGSRVIEMEESLQALREEHQSALRRARSMEEAIEAIDIAFSLHEVVIDPLHIPPIRTQEAARHLGHGELTRLIYRSLAQGRPDGVFTSEIAYFVAEHGHLPQEGGSFQRLKLDVRKRLRTLWNEGKVERLHEAKTQFEGRWRLPARTPDLSVRLEPDV